MSEKIRFVLCSDNHRLEKPLKDLLQIYREYDYFLHCGDSEFPKYMMQNFVSVCGNNDYFDEYPLNKILTIGNHRIYLTHGHLDFYLGKYEMLAVKAKKNGCDMVCFGHTHVPYDNTIDGVRLLNPGSIWLNRDGSKPSYMLVELDGDEIAVTLKRYE